MFRGSLVHAEISHVPGHSKWISRSELWPKLRCLFSYPSYVLNISLNMRAICFFLPAGLTDDEDIKMMLKGSLFWKIKGPRQQKQRLYRLQEDGMTIWFETRFKRAHSKHVCKSLRVCAYFSTLCLAGSILVKNHIMTSKAAQSPCWNP